MVRNYFHSANVSSRIKDWPSDVLCMHGEAATVSVRRSSGKTAWRPSDQSLCRDWVNFSSVNSG